MEHLTRGSTACACWREARRDGVHRRPGRDPVLLLIEELVRFGSRLDEHWHHPVADAAAPRWSLDRPRFVRSSASHVLVARTSDGSRLVLRARPDQRGAKDVLVRGARAADRWHRAGAPFTAAVRSDQGSWLEVVEGYAVQALRVVEGPVLAEREVTPADAHAWGAALGALHAAPPSPADRSEPPLPAVLLSAARSRSDRVGALAARLLTELAGLDADGSTTGLVHGDPEPDNVVLGPDGPVFVDPDTADRGWFAADVCAALVDWAAPAAAPDLGDPVPAAFVAGYRRVRPLPERELSALALHARVRGLGQLLDLERHVDAAPGPEWPDWATDLDARVRARAAELRAALLT